MLSLLLGSHPAEIPVSRLVPVAEAHGISGATLRVALSRMVAAGDLTTNDATYRLSDRLLARQRRQDAELAPTLRQWDGDWHQVVVTATGRGAVHRHELRRELLDARHAELREGVWLRPDNLERPVWSAATAAAAVCFVSRPTDDAVRLAATLWELTDWAERGRTLADRLATAGTPARRLTVAAALVRHLRTDPHLPDPLLPSDWPAADLRATYAAYRADLAATVTG